MTAYRECLRYLRRGGYIFVVVWFYGCWQHCAKTSERICMKFQRRLAMGPNEQMVKFSCRSRKRFARWRDWYRDTGRTYFGGGMHCSSAYSLTCNWCVDVNVGYDSNNDVNLSNLLLSWICDWYWYVQYCTGHITMFVSIYSRLCM